MKVLIILGHPRGDSYCAALADRYIRGARDAGVQVHYIRLMDLNFEIDVLTPKPEAQHVEPDLLRAQKWILWADHLAFVFPTWWGGVPALLKGFLDRTLTPGFAFREIQADSFLRMLKPRTAQVITTMDTPRLIDRLVNGSPIRRSFVNATLKFCGISPVRTLYLSSVKHVSSERRGRWLDRAYRQGLALKHGIRSPLERGWRSAVPWIKAIRLQFYPMTFFAYAAGSFAASRLTGLWDGWLFVLGYFLLFIMEVIVVFNNEYHDQKTDRLNRNFSAFSGGSRVLVDGEITERNMIRVTRVLIAVLVLLCFAVAIQSANHWLVTFGLAGGVFALGISYTAPPARLSYRGWGECVVAFTHSFAVILCGFVFQGGSITNVTPWQIGLPLFLSIMPAIIMAGIPDYLADKRVGKRTLAVRLGRRNASYFASLFVLLAPLAAYRMDDLLAGPQLFQDWFIMLVVHGCLVLILLWRFARREDKPKRIDVLLILSLLYILWYALLPFFKYA